MSDESSYYSPGEIAENEKENNVSLLARNLMSEFQDEVKTISNKNAESREPIKVYLRIRPFSQDELKASEDQGCLTIMDDKTVLLSAPRDSFTFKSSIRGIAEQNHQFSFSKVYDEKISQKDIFDDAMLGYVKDFLDGINCLVFTYGVTNSGKTFTIQGNPKNGGILPRALDVLFNSIKGKQYENMNIKPTMYQDVSSLTQEQQHYEEVLKKAVLNAGQKHDIDLSILWKMDTTSQSDLSTISAVSTASSSYVTANDDDYSSISEELKERVCDGTVIDIKSQGPVKFSVWVSFAEIYNEYVYDLLDPTPLGKGKKRPTLKLGDDKKGNPYIKGLKEIQVNSADEAFKVLRVGQKNQNIAATKLNQNSSRSHSIFTIKTLRVVDVDEPHVARISRLSFVDLAGSERYCKTQSTGDRLKEASNINTSIMTLGKCIEYLRYNQQHKNHPVIIPFRENKLTRLFQGFFVGKGKACMVVNISQCASVFDETYNVLKFASVAKQVTTKSVRNTEIFKPKQPTKPLLATATPVNKFGKHSLISMGFTTPRPIQKDIMFESVCDDNDDEPVQVLIKNYEALRKQLVDERRKNAMMELKIREEVCAEMSDQIVEIERNYNERLQEEQETMEEMCERRIEMLTKSMKKARKKRKLDRLESEDDVSNVLYQVEKARVKERDEIIRTLRAKLAEKEIAHEFYKQTHTPEQHPKVIQRLQSELDEAKETVKVNESHIEDLQTTLNCAQDALEEKELEVEKLKEVVELTESQNELVELKVLLEETSKALNEARLKLDGRDEKLKEKDDIITQYGEQLRSLQEKQLDKTEVEEFGRELARLEEQGKLLHERNEFQCSELKQLRLEKGDIDSQRKQLSNMVEELKRQLAESEDRREQLGFKDEEQKKRIKRFMDIVSNQETALAESEAIIEQLNEKIEQLTAERAIVAANQLQKDQEISEDEDEIVFKLQETDKEAKAVSERENLAQVESEKLDLKREVRHCREKIEDLEKELAMKEEELATQKTKFETELEVLSDRIDGAFKKLEDKEKEIDMLKIKHADEIRCHEEKFTNRENELKLKIDVFEKEVRELKAVAGEQKEEVNPKQKKSENSPFVGSEGKVVEIKAGSGSNSIQRSKMDAFAAKGVVPAKSFASGMKGVKPKAKPGSLIRASAASPRSPYKSSNVAFKEMEKTLKETSEALDKKNEQVVMKNRMVADLQSRIKELEDEIEILTEEKLSMKATMVEETSKSKNLELKMEEFNLEIQKANEDSAHFKEEDVRNKNDLSALKKEAQILKEKKDLLETTVEKFREKIEELETLLKEEKSKSGESEDQLKKLMSAQEVALKEISVLKEQLTAKKDEIVSLEGKLLEVREAEKNFGDLLSVKQELENSMKEKVEEFNELKIRHAEVVANLKSEVTELRREKGSLMDEVATKNSDLRSRVIELNKIMEENVELKSSLCKAEENNSLLELQIKLRTTEKELDSMHTKQQVVTALAKASRKEEERIKDMSEMIIERDEIMERQKEQIEDKQTEIDDLLSKLEDAKSLERDLIKKQQTIQELRWTIIKKDEKIKELNTLETKMAILENKLKEFDEMKFQKETLTMQVETQKRSIKEREHQLAASRKEIEELKTEIKLNAEKDLSDKFQTPKATPLSEFKRKNSEDIPLSELRDCTSSTKKSPTRLRRSTRARISSMKKTVSEENDPAPEHIGSSLKKKGSERKVLFDLNEEPSKVLQADTPESAQPEKKRRRKLLAKTVGICAESPQIIPPSPTKDDEVTVIVKRQLRSSSRK